MPPGFQAVSPTSWPGLLLVRPCLLTEPTPTWSSLAILLTPQLFARRPWMRLLTVLLALRLVQDQDDFQHGPPDGY